jgi:hypothetical protein
MSLTADSIDASVVTASDDGSQDWQEIPTSRQADRLPSMAREATLGA